MSREELLRAAERMNDALENGASKEEALEEAGLVELHPPSQEARARKQERLAENQSGYRVWLDDDGNVQREEIGGDDDE